MEAYLSDHTRKFSFLKNKNLIDVRLRQVTKKECSLRVRVPPKEEPLPTPEVEVVDDDEEENNQGLILVQSVLRGRAAQILVFEGRDNCRELIQELRSTHGVLSKQKIEVFKEKLEVKYDQREEVFCIANSNKIQEALSRLQGTLVGTLLDFLNKELRRLLDERKAHALGIMAERERQRREAAEAGRRQYELRRRLEHDEMFKQIVKIHQDTVDMYLEDIITEGMEFASKDEAKEYVIKLAKKFDEEITEKAPLLKDSVLEQEELIAELVHHFVLPEVEKAIIRQRIKKRQQIGLKSIHNELYNSIEKLPKPPPRSIIVLFIVNAVMLI
ncbi:hypothetical protein MML48_1g18958 [Holotrichia oblita]|uniref:Uncharacterized protein n=1 Tax=Holotrichia oblita TaxID=644536 RepID=A0ACB9TS98_HOLOL|nr:hypothetical protein MML48_1g18958 [Holotrichia oblita]